MNENQSLVREATSDLQYTQAFLIDEFAAQEGHSFGPAEIHENEPSSDGKQATELTLLSHYSVVPE